MAAPPPPQSLVPEIGPDGIARENPVIAYTERVRLRKIKKNKKKSNSQISNQISHFCSYYWIILLSISPENRGRAASAEEVRAMCILGFSFCIRSEWNWLGSSIHSIFYYIYIYKHPDLLPNSWSLRNLQC